MKQKISQRLRAILSSRKFFYGLVAFFVFEAVWIALSARYPMAFDEDFHFGVIKLYAANHFSPFFATQPAGADTFGAVAHDPSYLYHYLMSFPYRLVAAITSSQPTQIICLRLINVAFVAGGLFAARRVLLRARLSQALSNCVVAVFVLVPIVPLLAGQINYDNLLILTVPLTILLALRTMEGLRNRSVNLAQILLLVAALTLQSLVKYAFLPIAAAVVLYLLYYVARLYWRHWKEFWRLAAKSCRQLSRKTLAGLLVLLVISLGLFAQRYGVNEVKYHKLVPACDAVLSEDHCAAYSPWIRNKQYEAQKTVVDKNPASYANLWFHDMLLRSFFAINGPFSDFANDYPFIIPQAVVEVLFLASVLVGLLSAKQIFRGQPALQLLLLVSVFYTGVLWFDNYSSYLKTGQPVAINGRYLLLVLSFGIALAGLAFVKLLRKFRLASVQPILAIVVLLLMLQGGGFVTYILQSNDSWYWQGSRPVSAMNNAARTVLRPLVYKKTASRFLQYE